MLSRRTVNNIVLCVSVFHSEHCLRRVKTAWVTLRAKGRLCVNSGEIRRLLPRYNTQYRVINSTIVFAATLGHSISIKYVRLAGSAYFFSFAQYRVFYNIRITITVWVHFEPFSDPVRAIYYNNNDDIWRAHWPAVRDIIIIFARKAEYAGSGQGFSPENHWPS